MCRLGADSLRSNADSWPPAKQPHTSHTGCAKALLCLREVYDYVFVWGPQYFLTPVTKAGIPQKKIKHKSLPKGPTHLDVNSQESPNWSLSSLGKRINKHIQRWHIHSKVGMGWQSELPAELPWKCTCSQPLKQSKTLVGIELRICELFKQFQH